MNGGEFRFPTHERRNPRHRHDRERERGRTANFETSQTLPGFNIGDGADVTLGALPPESPIALADSAFDTLDAGLGLAGNAGQGVPEPGPISLLLLSAIGFLGCRKPGPRG